MNLVKFTSIDSFVLFVKKKTRIALISWRIDWLSIFDKSRVLECRPFKMYRKREKEREREISQRRRLLRSNEIFHRRGIIPVLESIKTKVKYIPYVHYGGGAFKVIFQSVAFSKPSRLFLIVPIGIYIATIG